MNNKGFSKVKIVLIIGCIVILMGACGIIRMACDWGGKAVQVALEEVDPRVLLNKYEWFKDASARLDKHLADSRGFQRKIKVLELMYKGTPRQDWSRVDTQTWSQWKAEVDGVAAAYTGLAAEYNARMVKINYAFCNRGQLPKGATEVLPREYKPYDVVFQ